ncbi:MAG TPA: hypothetical protein VF313_02710 [Anaerolineaceae bacterium]
MNYFQVLMLLARPAAGKSETFRRYLKNSPAAERLARFHVEQIDEIDDFPMLWTWSEEDDPFGSQMGKPRLHSTPDGYFLNQYLWDLLIRRISLDLRQQAPARSPIDRRAGHHPDRVCPRQRARRLDAGLPQP